MTANAHLDYFLEEDCMTEFENTFSNSMKVCSSDQLDGIIKGRGVIIDSIEKMSLPLGWNKNPDQIDIMTPRVFNPSEKITFITAIDSSVIYLTRTQEGRLYAAKSGVVISSGKRIRRHFRLGPMLIHVTEEFLRNSRIEHNLTSLLLIDSNFVKRLIRVRLERAIQLVFSRRLKNSIVLIDGALKPSVFEDSNYTIKRIVEISTLSNNDVIGLSKNTNLIILGQFEYLLKTIRSPAYIDTGYIIKGLARDTLGNNLLVKLGKMENEYVFRADICSANGNDLESLERLIGNDMLFRSYPESLRIAHHISIFTTTEASSLRRLISRSCGAEELDRTVTRRNILGVSFV